MRRDGDAGRGYIYGYDEITNRRAFGGMRRSYAEVKKHFPEVLRTAVALDYTYGELTDTLDTLDIWIVPPTEYLESIPAAERASEHAEFSHGGSGVSMFLYERYAMIATGRYVCMNLREAGKTFRLANVLFPQYSFKNALITARVSSVYAGSRYKKEAELFLSFLASEEYNQLLIDGADGLPPNPQIARRSTEFLTPARYPHEGTTHQNELKWAETIALPDSCSPYFPLEKTGIDAALDKVLNRLCSVETALAETEERINRTIREIADSTPDMRRRFQADLEKQKEITAIP